MEALYQITFQNIPFHGKGQTDNAPDRTKANVPLYVIRHDPARIFFLITIFDSEHKKIQGRTTYSASIVTHLRKTLYIALVGLTILMSCQKNEQSNLVQETDLKGIFEIGISEDWHIEKQESENSSFLIASDTTKTVEQTLVVDLTWNDWEIYLNEHFKRSLDSISNLSGFKTSKQKFYSRGEFDIYEYEAIGTDSLNNLGVKAKNYYLKKDGLKGSLNLNVRTNNRDFNQKDSLLIQRIIGTIKRNR